MPQLDPTITFIMPIQNKQDFIIEQINTIFKFSEQYRGFCEIIVLTDEVEDAKLKLAWLAIKLNKMSHPHVRTRIIRYTSRIGLTSLIETSINHALGQKIVIITEMPEMIEIAKINDLMKRDILTTPYMLNIYSLQENLN
jgi:glycosyltransferase involved in cell wall biosynthesis